MEFARRCAQRAHLSLPLLLRSRAFVNWNATRIPSASAIATTIRGLVGIDNKDVVNHRWALVRVPQCWR
jgi:hypothetical protein